MEGYSFLGRSSPRAQSLKVYILGVGYKTVAYEEDWSVQELCSSLAHKLRLPDEHLFGIFEVYGELGTGKEKCIKDSDTLRHKLEMAIVPGRQFVFKYKYLIDMKITRAEDRAMDMYYLQTKENILSGYYHAPLTMAVDLAAIQMQVEFGTFNPKTHVSGFLYPRIRDFLPSSLLGEADGRALETNILSLYCGSPEVKNTCRSRETSSSDCT